MSNNTDNVTIIKEGASFEGKLVFEGNVLISGKFNGEIFSSGELMVSKTGYVEGKIEIGSVVIQGEVNGDIKAKQKIVINAPAAVRGDIIAPSLIIEEGAVFEGNCSMGRDTASNTADRPRKKTTDHDNVVDFQLAADDK